MKKKNYFYLAALSLNRGISRWEHVATTRPQSGWRRKDPVTWITVLKTPVHGVTICITLQCC